MAYLRSHFSLPAGLSLAVAQDSSRSVDVPHSTPPEGNAAMVMELDVALPAVFVACTVNVDEPPVVGVPDNTPAELNVIPAGNAPEATDHVGAGDPNAVNV